jgi:alpha-methylacyl-CoA racemase
MTATSSQVPPPLALLPLRGRLILDCSTLLPGPRVGKLLAQKGARVIKIESPSKPDRVRDLGPFYDDLNGLKEVRQLEIAPGAAGRKGFEELVSQADGLIEGYRPATKSKLGLDSPTLHALNPRLCILSLTGYPEDGPHRERPAHDMNLQAETGFLSLFNELPGLPLADLFGAYEGALALTAAMDAVTRGGPNAQGTRVVVSLAQALTEVQSSAVAVYRATGEAPKPGETLFSGKFPCYRIYTAGCGRRVAFGPLEPKFWIKACEILGATEVLDGAYAVGKEGALVTTRIQQALGSKPWSHWAPLFAADPCCVDGVREYSEVFGE